jgi:hypothetical protein
MEDIGKGRLTVFTLKEKTSALTKVSLLTQKSLLA